MCQSENPIACVLEALSAPERARAATLRAELTPLLCGPRELANGYAWSVRDDAGSLGVLGEWIRLERRCCPFLCFELVWHTSEPQAFFRVTGPQGTKEFLRAELPSLATDDRPR